MGALLSIDFNIATFHRTEGMDKPNTSLLSAVSDTLSQESHVDHTDSENAFPSP